MERYRLKNIIILILVLLNLSLLLSLGGRRTAERSARRQVTEQLVELFSADQISLVPDLIPYQAPPASRTLVRDLEQERAIATALLGKSLRQSNSGDVVHGFDSDAGAALFRSNGSFDIRGTLCAEDAEALCESFCHAFSYGQPTFLLDQDGSGSGSAVYRHNKLPVFNCTVTFTR